MIKYIFKKSLPFNLFIMLSSCTGQGNSTSPTTSNSVGAIVESIDDRIWVVYQDQKSNYWFGSNGNGVYRYDGATLRQFTKQHGVVDDQIRGIQGDQYGNIYIETPKGVSKYDGSTFTTLKVVSSPSNKWKLEPDDLWFNCNGNAHEVYRYDGKFLYELSLPRQNLEKAFGYGVRGLGFNGMNSSPYSIFGIDKDSNGNVWFGTIVAGAFRYDGQSFLWIGEKELSTLPDGRVPGVRSMIEDKDGNIWLSNFISKYRINTENSEETDGIGYKKLKGADISKGPIQERLPYFVSGLRDDKNEVLWMATYGGGVWKYDGKDLTNYPIIDGDEEILLISIYQDKQGLFWLGTDNAGVYTFDGKIFEKFKL